MTVWAPTGYDKADGSGLVEWIDKATGICLVEKVLIDGYLQVAIDNGVFDVRLNVPYVSVERLEDGLNHWFCANLKVVDLRAMANIHYSCCLTWDTRSFVDASGTPLVFLDQLRSMGITDKLPMEPSSAYVHAVGVLAALMDPLERALGVVVQPEYVGVDVLHPVSTPWDVLD